MFKFAARVWVIILTIVVAISLTFNVAVVAFASVSSIVASAYDAVTGTASAYSTLRNRAQTSEGQADDLLRQRDRLLLEAEDLQNSLDQATLRSNELFEEVELSKAHNSQLTDEIVSAEARIVQMEDDLRIKNTRLNELTEEIVARDTQIARLSDDLARNGDDVLQYADNVIYRGTRTTLADAVVDTNGRVARRTAVAATRNSSSIVAEAIPYLGIAAMLAVTAYDLKDSCDTIKDLHELDVAIDPSKEFSADQTAVCGLSVPTKEEVWEQVKNGSVDAWHKASEYLPSLPEYELPSWRDFVFWR